MATAASRLSSVRGRAALLGGAVLAAAAVVAGISLVRDGDDETDARREAVSAYIVELNTAQQASIVELDRVSSTYRRLRVAERADPAQLRRVEDAEASLRRVRARLAALPAPPEAARLRRELLRLVDLQVGLAEEVAGMVRYLPLQAEQSQRLAAAARKLQAGLEGSPPGAGQRAAFTAFRGELLATIAALERAAAPEVLEPSRTEEIERLRTLAALAQRLGAALDDGDAAEIERLFPQFVRSSTPAGTTKAERDAVVAFNRRIARIADVREAIAREQERLDLALR